MLLLDEEVLQRVSAQAEVVDGNTNTEEHEEVGLPSLPNFQKDARDIRKDAYIPHLTLHFDKPTTFLCIPLRRIRNALQNESYQTNLGKHNCFIISEDVLICVLLVIRGELKLVCITLAERIERLKPWLSSHRVITTKVKSNGILLSC